MLALLLALQGSGLILTATVDRPRLNVGEDVVLTIVAGGKTADAVDFDLPAFNGFALVSRSERTEISLTVERTRVTTLELTLRATRAGSYAFGPIRISQGTAQVSIDGPDVEVTENAAAGMVALNPRVRDLVARSPPPRTGNEASVQVVLSRDTVLVGEQVDVLTAAWFSRDLRGRLRRQPRFEPPVLTGVWAFPQTALPGIAASKKVGDKWYDLFVLHQVVFPLAPGVVTIPPVALTYEIPVAMQFFSQDERYTVSSPPRNLTVLPLPAAGQPPGFAGATGVNLRLERQITPTMARANEAVNVEIAVRGEGNVGLWPAPDLQWPPGTRAYAEGSSEEMQPIAGRLAGTKRFTFVVVPTQAGVLPVPTVSYPYYDFGRKAYVTPTLAAVGVAVGAGSEAAAARTLPPTLLVVRGAPVAYRISSALPPWAWALLLLLPPLLVYGISLRRSRQPAKVLSRRKSDDPALALDRALKQLLPREDIATRERLIPALRGVGLDDQAAADIADLRDRVQGFRYGPEGSFPAPPDGALTQVLAWLREAATQRPVHLGLMLLVLIAAPAQARQVTPDSLYAVGALSRAEAGYETALKTSPRDPALWYGLGAARYRQGQDGGAAAAWLTALRLAPRDGTIRRALLLTPPPDQSSAARRGVPPFTGSEAFLLLVCCWLTGCVFLLIPRMRQYAPGLLLIGVVAGALALSTWWWEQRPLVLAIEDTPLRSAPHGRAPAIRTLPSGAAVLVEREQPGWVLVRAGGSEQGWLPRTSVAPVGE